ncbi:NAD(+) synthase [Ruminococcus albus]|uniref:Glutamine-dependent NAD(+) synthetase n=1 Tax=Ruminococcus albus TaxID=1264 RepID=A0A1I1S4H7_RUMAL|nr:NAD(+) synthase [Ruminococcus albus]SFD41504.1 NAD+ synthase (glutamine-hydrolysing) [Ruminococcus albus]
MKDGYIIIACATPSLKVADCPYNADRMIELIDEAHNKGVKIVCFPELSITGYTCADLFLQDTLLESAKRELLRIIKATEGKDIVSIVGVPLEVSGKLYNCAVIINKGKAIGAVAKKNIPNYSEFYEVRHFTAAADDLCADISLGESYSVHLENTIFACKEMPDITFGIEICEDMWVCSPPAEKLAASGAVMIFNLSASDEVIGKAEYRRTLIKAHSGSMACAYAYADCGIGESTQDMVFAGHDIIAENGSILAESKPFSSGLTIADIDVKKLHYERRRMNSFKALQDIPAAYFSLDITKTKLDRTFPQTPFVPTDKNVLDSRCEEILTMQAVGLMTRLRHIGCKTAVLGLSGGLDSTLALIVTVHAFDMLGLERSGIHTITMPCFGTTDRTYNNAVTLAKAYGASLSEINICKSVTQHFEDIGQSADVHDVTYENSQARERTQVLMDKANQQGGIVIGTGDLSELTLGWATYNGDHMSMYAVNASIPKTLVRWLVNYEAQVSEGELKTVLEDILDTPVSPELLPPEENGTISQKTEDIVGPYELHDFFMYYMLRCGFTPSKIFRIACIAFNEKYTKEVILKWLKTFYRRFFSQQFKRSCLPDGPKVGTVTLSPRGDWRMPSDASASIWLKEIENIQL